MSRILVTGGLGAVGTVLTEELHRRGHTVDVSDRMHHHAANYTRCDVGEYRQVARLVEAASYDYVYHLAAEFGRWNGEDYYESLWRTNVVGTKHLLMLQERLRFRLVAFSSSEVYGDYDGVMSEDVMDRVEIRQMNDYALTKWVNEIQVLNAAAAAGTETVRVRLFNTYGPGEHYSPYRSAICVFAYRALHDLPYTVYRGHHRTSSYVTDTARTLANIAERFKPGEVYNIAGTEYHDMKTASDMILAYLGKDDRLVEYRDSEPRTTRDKRVDPGKAARDLDHRSEVPLHDGIPRTLEWMKQVYGPGPARRR